MHYEVVQHRVMKTAFNAKMALDWLAETYSNTAPEMSYVLLDNVSLYTCIITKYQSHGLTILLCCMN